MLGFVESASRFYNFDGIKWNSKFISLSSVCDKLFYLQEGIQPMWEDDRNRQGGRWLVNTQKNFRQQELDRLWVETVSFLFFKK